ncbi:MAG: alpha-glucan family phosphorylase [bacterium]
MLPRALEPLGELASNLLWAWDPDLFRLFRRVDSELWEQTCNNPIQLLGLVNQDRLDELSKDEGFLHHLRQMHERFKRYLTQTTWYGQKHGPVKQVEIAYFSAEYGLARCLPIYSGGLGILSGDHMKSASDLGLPLVGVGLLYQKGYFRQSLDTDGWQRERHQRNDFYNMPLTLERDEDGAPLTISVEYPGRNVVAQIWRVQVGRVSLLLMDTNIPENSKADQDIGDYLYGGNREIRIQQEMMLGIGGLRMLSALEIKPKVFHMNEGHSAFMALERIRQLMTDEGLSFSEARIVCASGNVFTTHTAVSAGFDLFERRLVEKYLGPHVAGLDIDFERFMALGRGDPFDGAAPFNMALFAARNANAVNGVSKLHGEVTRRMFHAIMPEIPVHEIPVGSITNGIHARTWTAPELASLYDRYLGERWVDEPANHSVWEKVYEIPDAELWRAHERRRGRLVTYTRERLKAQLGGRGFTKSDLDVADEVLDPEILTIGFARRFATYKRATLILTELERLKRLLNHPSRPIQLLFAGKAHPLDEPGKRLIQQLVHFSEDPLVRRRVVFLDDYDIETARILVGGVDVWLNNPQRPMEASGTSGMKVVFNGGLNFSILDGWWCEGFEPDVGWAIGAGEEYTDVEYGDLVEGRALFRTLENDIVPLFYDRDANDLPRGWISMMKHSIARLGPVYNTNRMVQAYHDEYYLKAAQGYARLSADGFGRAREQAAWLEQVYANWTSVQVVETTLKDPPQDRPVGGTVEVTVQVQLGQLRPTQVAVEAYAGLVDDDFEIPRGTPHTLQWQEELGPGLHLFGGAIPCDSSGQHGFLCRIRPEMPGAPKLLGTIRWE